MSGSTSYCLLRRRVFLCVLLFVEIASAQQTIHAVDGYIARYTAKVISEDFIEQDTLKNNRWAVQTPNDLLTFLVQEELIRLDVQVLSNSEENESVLDITTKGTYIESGKEVELDGVVFIKKIRNGTIVKTKRYSINESVQQVKNPTQKSEIWEKKQNESSAFWKKWAEPSLILSAMILSVYLLFTVRS